jgi:HD-like signal output (HDOD) protein
VDLPSFPEIAIRVRRVLADPDSSADQVVRVVGSEPALAARLMRIANSASFNRSGRAVADLRTAISRIGYNMVRSAAISFAMAQIRNANKLAGLEHYLKDLWERSTRVAAFGFVLARSAGGVNPDEALLGGVLHGIGKLYVLTRAGSHPELFADIATLDDIIADWHAAIGKAILENWEFSEEMASAIGDQEDHARAEPAPPDLKDVVAVAAVMAAHCSDPDALAAALKGLATAERFGLTPEKTRLLLEESAIEVSALSSALGD